MSRHLLVEIGCEEIPARFVEDAVDQLGQLLTKQLSEQRIAFDNYQLYATPRRLAVLIKDVAEQQAEQVEEVRGPALRIAQDEAGQWRPAALGFARKQGVKPEELVIRKHKGEEYIFAQKQQQGMETTVWLQKHLPQVFQRIHFPSTMRWGNRYRFVRPVRWLVVLWGEEVIPVEWVGLRANRITRGHRFLGQADVPIERAELYVETLRAQNVIVDHHERREIIAQQIKRLEETHRFTVPIEEKLLNEVTHLVEYPTSLVGHFASAFLELPKRVLTTTMREHQRYFSVEDDAGQLLPHFVTVRNGDQRSIDLVRKGNEKVLTARLEDASFFFAEDLKRSIDQAVDRLDRMVFREQLGTMGDRVRRVGAIAVYLGQQLSLDEESMACLKRAAQICKFDLATQMVDEFSELEGYMGYEYAKRAGEDPRVALAVLEHHEPRSAQDALPTDIVGAVLSLADKIDTIASHFGIGIQPTGSQDPYSLRRKASGILQILESDERLPFSLQALWRVALDILEQEQLLQQERSEVEAELSAFFRTRVKTLCQAKEIRYDVIEAIVAQDDDPLPLRLQKAYFLMDQLTREEFKWEVEAFTRAQNLVVSKDEGAALQPDRLQEPAEQELYQAWQQAESHFNQAVEDDNVLQMYEALQTMTPVIHRFFDQIMVMVDEDAIRRNRLALLRQIVHLCRRLADFSALVFPSE